jgi:drug/metabolite transporter (DMT)-like permease
VGQAVTVTAILLLIASAIIHAVWNASAKSGGNPSASFFMFANILGILWFVPAVLIDRHVIALIPWQVWCLIAATGFCQAAYYAGLAGAYRCGEMSVAYPILRSSPIIVVLIVTILLGRKSQVSNQCIFGILMVVAGCFLVPMRHFSDFRLKNYLNLTCMFALLAAFATAGYSIIDDEALRALRNHSDIHLSKARISILYIFLEGVSSLLWVMLFVFVSPNERMRLRSMMTSGIKGAFFTGTGMVLAYILVLLAMAFVANVSYVVAFRQLSIPIGTAISVLLLKESRSVPKFVGVAVIFAGVVLVSTG